MRKLLYIVLLLIAVPVLAADDWKILSIDEMLKVLQDGGKQFAAPTYSVKIRQQSFQNYTTTVVSDNSDGYFVKNNKQYASYSLGIKTIQNDKMRITVDSLHNAIALGDPSEIEAPGTVLSRKVLELSSSIKSKKVSEGNLYRIEFKNNSLYNALEAVIDQKGVKAIILYFSRQIPLDMTDKNSTKSSPRVEIKFFNYTTNVILPPADFSEQKYFTSKNNKLVPTGQFSRYTIKDLRTKTK